MVIDPVCGQEVDEGLSLFSLVYKRKRYVFCSAACHAKFKRSPDGFVH